MAGILFLSSVLLMGFSSEALKLPSYIKPCQRHNPKFNECALKNGIEAIPSFVNGDRKYRIPSLNPLTVYDFKMEDKGSNSVGLNVIFKEAHIYGLQKAQFTRANFDMDARKVNLDFTIDDTMILGEYNVSGRVLVLPITGNGQANITLTNLQLMYKFDYDLISKGKSNKDYIQIKDSNLAFNVGRAYFKFGNLFNGDKLLGDNMNTFLNDNWREVVKELGPAVAEAIGQVIRQILGQITTLVPIEYIFVE